MTDPTYSEFRGTKDLRYEANPRLEAAWLEDWDKRSVTLAPTTLRDRDLYGYFALYVLGFISGVLTILCAGGR